MTLEEAKLHLRVDENEEDVYIAGLIATAREWCEGFQRRSYMPQTWELSLNQWPDKPYIALPRPPLIEVESIKYTDHEGNETVLSAESYIVDNRSEPGKVVLAYGKSWPNVRLAPVNGIIVRYLAGYTIVPDSFKQAIMLLIDHWYQNRSAVEIGSTSRIGTEAPMGTKSLLWPGRVWGGDYE